MSRIGPRKHWIFVLLVGLGTGACQNDASSVPVPPEDPTLPPDFGGAGIGGFIPSAGTGVPPVGGTGFAGPPCSDNAVVLVAGSFAPPPPENLNRITVSAATPPPPISGGTLLATKDGKLLVASDPDRDLIYFVDSAAFTLLHVRTLNAGDEPGRLVEDAAGRIHVALRGGHALASMTRDAQSPITRRAVCDLPRGVTYDAAHDLLHVACAEGTLVSLAAQPDGAIARAVEIGRDARDVIARGDQLFVTHFRSAELHRVAADGTLVGRVVPPTFSQPQTVFEPLPACSTGVAGGVAREFMAENTPTIAWRAIDVPGHGIAMLHQRARTDEIQVTNGGYGSGSCGSGIVQTSITTNLDSGNAISADIADAALAVDIATDPEGALLAMVAPGNWGTGTQVQLFALSGASAFDAQASNGPQQPSNGAAGAQSIGFNPGQNPCLAGDGRLQQPDNQATAIAFASPYMLAVQEREPAGISFIDTRTGAIRVRLDLKQASRFDTGHSMFHMRAGAGVACASCHAEAGDDSHVWSFHGIGARRTQTLRGGILGTEPFHWNGDMQDFPTLVREVFVGRMAGFSPQPDQTSALAHWIDKQPALHAQPADSSAALRGKTLFESESVGCSSCHSGEHFTNNHMADVGTGVPLQVPSLRGVAFRSPLMHNGCAANLSERFGSCGGGDQHGHTSQLKSDQIQDLVAYLETL
jgi:hypothetical protein